MEVKSERDGAWYSAHLSPVLGESLPTLLAEFYEFENDTEELYSLSDVKERVRCSSVPVEVDQCHLVQAGMTVCALRSTKDSSMYFDAEVVAARHDHEGSKRRGECRCRFLVSWKEGEGAGGPPSEIRSEDICLISSRDIMEDQLIAWYARTWDKWVRRREMQHRGEASQKEPCTSETQGEGSQSAADASTLESEESGSGGETGEEENLLSRVRKSREECGMGDARTIAKHSKRVRGASGKRGRGKQQQGQKRSRPGRSSQGRGGTREQ